MKKILFFLRRIGSITCALSLLSIVILSNQPLSAATQLIAHVERVSVASDGIEGNSGSGEPSISASGRFVAFVSAATNLISPNSDTNNVNDIFVHDLQTHKTVRVSVGTNGLEANGASSEPSISASGRFVAFGSSATNLIIPSSDTNNARDIFVHDRDSDEDYIFDEIDAINTFLVSVSSSGLQSNGNSQNPSFSADGNFVAFSSAGTNLVSPNPIGAYRVFIRDLRNQETTVIGEGFQPDISRDGRLVAYVASAVTRILVYDRQLNLTFNATQTYDGKAPSGSSVDPSISNDGKFVTYISSASNIVDNDTNDQPDLFLYSLQNGGVWRISDGAVMGSQSNQTISDDGRFISFGTFPVPSPNYALLINRQTSLTRNLTVGYDGSGANGTSYNVSVSANGDHVAFLSSSSNLVPGDTNGTGDIFVYIGDTLPDKASELTQTLIGTPYLKGGKGYDFVDSVFLTSDQVLQEQYNYYNKDAILDFGKGIDCSGLVLWSYNTAAGDTRNWESTILYPNADGQYRHNTQQIGPNDVLPGDLLFFDKIIEDDKPQPYIDHVAMYIGGDEVIESRGGDGVIISSLQRLQQQPAFRGFGRVIDARTGIIVRGLSPINLIVSDPDGFTITADTILVSEEEIAREIPGIWYYSEWDSDGNGNVDDTVISPELKPGVYSIKVVPEPDALPTDTYSLEVEVDGKVLTVAANVPISEIPSKGYKITSNGTDITVSTNETPVANPDTFTIPQNTPAQIDVLANDTDDGIPNSLSVTAVQQPANGTAVIEANKITYTPNSGFTGIDTFQYTISDGELTTAALVTITVVSVNVPPLAVADITTTDEDAPLTIAVLANDTDADGNLDSTSASIVASPVNGIAMFNDDHTVTYTPNPNFNSSDSFTYHVCDIEMACATAIVTITIDPVNDPPTLAQPADQFSDEGEDIALQLIATDVDGDVLRHDVSNLPADLLIPDLTTGFISGTIAPDAAKNSPYTVTVRVVDAAGAEENKSFLWTINRVNDLPILNVEQMQVAFDEGQLAINAGTVNDPDGDTISLTSTLGTVVNNNDGTWSWNFQTTDGPIQSQPVTIYGDDGHGGVGQVTFGLMVYNAAPILNAGADMTIISGMPFAINATFVDPGTGDTHVATIDFGIGGGAQPASISEVNGAGIVTANHAYFEPMAYNVTICVTDDEGAMGCDTLVLQVTPLQVGIDIKPGEAPNSINLKSNGNIPTAILSSPTFDAATVDPLTVTLANAPGLQSGKNQKPQASLEDINGDGLNDLVLHFDIQALRLNSTDTQAVLIGRTYSGTYIMGVDAIQITP